MSPRADIRIGRIARIAIPAALAVGALLPAGALGSTASVSGNDLFYFSAVGETNNVTVAVTGPNVVVTDTGATITPMAGCAAVNVNQVTCPVATVDVIDLRLGNLNDTAVIGPSVQGIGDADFETPVFIQGDAGNDDLTGGPAIENALFGAGSSSDSAGTDTLIGGSLEDDLSGSDDADSLIGGGGSDTFDGGGGADTMSAGSGADRFSGGSAPDGADSIDGGPGLDTLDMFERVAPLSIDVDGVADDGAGCPGLGCEGDNVAAIEGLQGGRGDDVLTGTAAMDFIQGADGNDQISGGGSTDQLGGGRGNDLLSGGDDKDFFFGDGGNDTMDGGTGDDQFGAIGDDGSTQLGDSDTYVGGPGTDMASYEGGEDPVSVSLDGVPDDGRGCPGPACEGDNVGADIEDLIGTVKADLLIGNASANEIEGGGGDDQIIGAAGADGLIGDAGDDSIDGGADVDSIDGGSGADALRSRDRDSDQVDCGSSLDTLLADAKDEPEPSCDRTSRGLAIAAKAKLAGGEVALKVSCPAAEGVDCKAKLKLAKGKKTLDSAKSKIKSGKTKTVKLEAKGLGNGGTLEASGSFKDATGEKVTTRQRVRVG